MSTNPDAVPPLLKKKRRGCLGCLAWVGGALVIGVLLLLGVGFYMDHERTNEALQRGIAALQNSPDDALVNLKYVHDQRPNDVAVSQLYQDAQQKWLEALDRQLADKTPMQRYSILAGRPVSMMSPHLSDPYATAFRQYIERNTEEARVQIDESVEQAMNLVEAGKFKEGWDLIGALPDFNSIPGMGELRPNFYAFYAERRLVYAGDLAQNGQVAPARDILDWVKKNYSVGDAQTEALFRVDLADYFLHLKQAANAARTGDTATAQTKLEEAKALFGQLLASPALENFYPDLAPQDRGTPLIKQFVLAQAVVEQAKTRPPKR